MRTKYIFLTILMACLSVATYAQNLKGRYSNEQYNLYLVLDVDNPKVKIPGDDIYGEMPGYFGAKGYEHYWMIIECTRVSDNKAEITVINDSGSEDFMATLTEDSEGNITMKHLDGSPFKSVVKGKYVKVSKKVVLKKE